VATYPVVSIITPCYNSEKYIYRLFDSVLAQTYPSIEFVLVNDGSTDNIDDVVLSYKDRFDAKGIKLVYVKKENGGVASAINKGLEIFSGDFVTFPDSDDWMTDDCIEKKVAALQSNPECGIVVGTLDVRMEDNVEKSINLLKYKNIEKRNIFDDMVLEKGVFVTPIGWMIRSDMFLSVCPQRHIDDSNRMGQNWQLMLPICYKYDCAFIEDVVGYYLVRSNSLSHSHKTFEARYNKVDAFMSLKKNALMSIPSMDENVRNNYLNMIIKKYAGKKLKLAVQMKNKDCVKAEYNNIKSIGCVTISDRIWYMRGTSKAFDLVAKVAELPSRAINSIIRRVRQR